MKKKQARIVRHKFKTAIHEVLVVEASGSSKDPAKFSATLITRNHFVGLTEVKACVQSIVFVKYEDAVSQAFKWVSEVAVEYIKTNSN